MALESRPYELGIEALMLRLAKEANLQAPEGHVATWTSEGTEQRGIVVRSFLDGQTEALVLGCDILSTHDPDYDSQQKWTQTPATVREALAQQEKLGAEGLLVAFAQLLCFDAWIGNGDRHQENWGLIDAGHDRPCRLAPFVRHGSLSGRRSGRQSSFAQGCSASGIAEEICQALSERIWRWEASNVAGAGHQRAYRVARVGSARC